MSLAQSSFIGVWQRESIRIEEGDAFEDSNVLWLHAGAYFADLRWPKPGENQVKTSAFSGRADWNAPNMKFCHEIDLTKEFEQDIGNLSFSKGKLIEVGLVRLEGRVIRFKETWIQLGSADQHDCQVARKLDETGSGYIVRVGDFVIAMEETDQLFSAAAWKRENKNWNLMHGLGETARLHALTLTLTTNTLPAEWLVKV